MNDLEILDVSDSNTQELKLDELSNKPKKDKFMMVIYILLIILIMGTLLLYFFGYDLVKPFIKV